MAQLSFSQFANGTTADAGDVNTELLKLFNRVNSGMESDNIADAAVTTAKIADANVTAAKIGTDAVTTAKIQDAAVTSAKLASGIGDPRALDVVTAEATGWAADEQTEEDVWTYSVPANTIGADGLLVGSIDLRLVNDTAGVVNFTVKLIYGSTTISTISIGHGDAETNVNKIEFSLKGDGTTSSQEGHLRVYRMLVANNATLTYSSDDGTAAEDSTGALNLKISVACDTTDNNISYIMKHAYLLMMDAL